MVVLKKILKNIGILIGVACAVCLVCIGVLFFSPDINIFGIRWIKPQAPANTDGIEKVFGGYVQSVKVDSKDISKFIIKTSNIPVKIKKHDIIAERNTNVIKFENTMSGLTNAEVKNKTPFNLYVYHDTASKTVTITVSELEEGWFMKGSSCLTLELAGDVIDRFTEQTNLSDEVVKKGTIEVETLTGSLEIDDLRGKNVKDEKGNEIHKKAIENLSFKTKGKTDLFKKNGAFTLKNNVSNLAVSNVNGNININAIVKKDITLQTNSGSIKFNTKVVDSNVVIQTVNSNVTFDEINGKLSYYGKDNQGTVIETSGGKITGNKLGDGCYIKTKNADTNIACVSGPIDVEISGKGKINFGLCDSNVINVKGGNGDININTFETDYKNAIVYNITTKKGNINLNIGTAMAYTGSEEVIVNGFGSVWATNVKRAENSKNSFLDDIKISSTDGKINFNNINDIQTRAFITEYFLVNESYVEKISLSPVTLRSGYNGKLDITTKNGDVTVGRFGSIITDLIEHTISSYNPEKNIVIYVNEQDPQFKISRENFGGTFNIRVVELGKANINASLSYFEVGSSISTHKGNINVKLPDSLENGRVFPAYIAATCTQKPTIRIGIVDKLNADFTPTAINGATPDGYKLVGARILTINNEKGKTNIESNIEKA